MKSRLEVHLESRLKRKVVKRARELGINVSDLISMLLKFGLD
jgi:antitoxin component of RelBE/YafQ-DinJ toxin-antitoxin module